MTEEGQVIVIHSPEAWDEQLDKGYVSHKLIVLYFTATWCGPCRPMNSVYEEYAKEFLNVTFLKVDVSEVEEVANQWGITAMPTFVFLKNGEPVDKLMGANKSELHLKIAKHA